MGGRVRELRRIGSRRDVSGGGKGVQKDRQQEGCEWRGGGVGSPEV